MSDIIFVEHLQRDVFKYLVSLPDKNGKEHDLEVKIIFTDGKLDEVQPPFAIKDKDTDLREYWQMQGQIAQMIENATRQVETGKFKRPRPHLDIEEESGDVAPKPQPKVEEKKEKPGKYQPKKMKAEDVVALRRKFRSRKHKNLDLNSEGRRYDVTGQSVSNAVLGKTWAAVTEEPPLTVAEYDRAIARPNLHGRVYHEQEPEGYERND